MSYPDVDQPPLKKRRFFAEESPPAGQKVFFDPPPHHVDALSVSTQPITIRTASVEEAPQPSNGTDLSVQNDVTAPSTQTLVGFDKQVFESFVGQEVPNEAMVRIQALSDNNMERAINMYLDGSWMKITTGTEPSKITVSSSRSSTSVRYSDKPELINKQTHSPPVRQLDAMLDYRYVGAFGVGAWATRSGTSLVGHGESVKIERTKIKPPVKIGRGGKVIQPSKGSAARLRTDIIVRFTNAKGEEIGRLPKDTALWVSTLMDQKVCRFDGICVFIPDRVRVNDTIYLQLRCSLLKRAFEAGSFVKPEDNNRTTGIFEEKETSAEKDLRLRQVALVKLFVEVNLHPSTINETTAKHKREGILQAAETAEQDDKDKESKKHKPSQDPGSSPPVDDEAEEGEELEQDQLDSLYKKAQSFDFDTPTREPAESFTMNLRKYQKQALHWMMSKEKDEKSETKETSMHPLWEEYSWPTKDMDDKDVPAVASQNSFFVNPYSGELSLEFPVQEQHCLGGILADGKHRFLFSMKYANLGRNGPWEDH